MKVFKKLGEEYRQISALARDAQQSPMIRIDKMAEMLAYAADVNERRGELDRAQALRQFSADLQEWALTTASGGTPRFPPLAIKPGFVP